MIFVTVGTSKYPFNRLLRKIDELIENDKIKDKVIAQIGYSTYQPKKFSYFSFTTQEKILELNKKANLIISHGGVGSIILALRFKKTIIVVPRLKKFGEHIDDHQLQIAKAFAKKKKILACMDIEELEKYIKIAKMFKPKIERPKSRIVEIIKKYLQEIANKNSNHKCLNYRTKKG